MEMYKKPIMNIIEMENEDVLTCSGHGGTCSPIATHTGAANDGCLDTCQFNHEQP